MLEARQKAASEKEVIVEPKIEQNAEEQQSGTLRGQSEQVQTEGKRDSDMSIVNEAKLQDGQVVEEVAPPVVEQTAVDVGGVTSSDVSEVVKKPQSVISQMPIEGKFESPYIQSLKKLGYSDNQIASLTIEQQQQIVDGKIEAPVIDIKEQNVKTDSRKENVRQEKIADAQKKLDEELSAFQTINTPTEQPKETIPTELVSLENKPAANIQEVTPAVDERGRYLSNSIFRYFWALRHLFLSKKEVFFCFPF